MRDSDSGSSSRHNAPYLSLHVAIPDHFVTTPVKREASWEGSHQQAAAELLSSGSGIADVAAVKGGAVGSDNKMCGEGGGIAAVAAEVALLLEVGGTRIR